MLKIPFHVGLEVSFFLFFKCRFINREGIDFSDAQNMQPIQVLPSSKLTEDSKLSTVNFCLNIILCLQEWDLVENLQGVLEYQTK